MVLTFRGYVFFIFCCQIYGIKMTWKPLKSPLPRYKMAIWNIWQMIDWLFSVNSRNLWTFAYSNTHTYNENNFRNTQWSKSCTLRRQKWDRPVGCHREKKITWTELERFAFQRAINEHYQQTVARQLPTNCRSSKAAANCLFNSKANWFDLFRCRIDSRFLSLGYWILFRNEN